MGVEFGFYGKLPTHGDFIRRGLPDRFVSPWDHWLQRMLWSLREQNGGTSPEQYVQSPTWRFVLRHGLAGDEVWAGVLIPSQDRVGRGFPVCIAAGLPSTTSVFRCAAISQRWFEHLERVGAEALAGGFADLGTLLGEIETTLIALPPMRRMLRALDLFDTSQANMDGDPWRFVLSSASAIDLGMVDALEMISLQTLGESSLWWTDGAEGIAPEWRCDPGWPQVLSTAAFDSWRVEYAEDVLAAPTTRMREADVPQTATQLIGDEPDNARAASESSGIAAAAWTTAGKVRHINEDAHLIATEAGMWAVADGMGGHTAGDVASRTVIDALTAIPFEPDLALAIQRVKSALVAANLRLRQMATDPEQPQECGTTVVILLVRGIEGAVIWVGDSRIYRVRGVRLERLTRDHSTEAETGEDGSASILDLLGGRSGELTRAVGGTEELEADVELIEVQPGDRWLVCTDGLYTEVAEAGLGAALRARSPEESVALLAAQVEASAARDNATAVVIRACRS